MDFEGSSHFYLTNISCCHLLIIVGELIELNPEDVREGLTLVSSVPDGEWEINDEINEQC